MPTDPDDVTPDQLGKTPSEAELRERQVRFARGVGRAGRMRSWVTALLALLLVVACLLLFQHTR